MRKEMPLQNALFLLIPVSYVAGWTLTSKIILSPISELGPIDLQIDRGNGILMPTYTIVEAYDKLMEKGINLEEGQNIAPILQQLQSFDPSEIEQFRRINELSSDIAVKVLKHCMMRKVNQREVKKVINIFTDPEKSKTHGRPIFGSDIERVDKNRYFNIECVKTTDKIWQNITEYHMRMVAHMRGNQIVKVIESEEDSIEAVKS
jgi:hypothetical protein